MKDKKVIDGRKIDYVSLNIFLYGKADPDYVEATHEMFEFAKPKLKSLERPIIVGTSCEMDKGGGKIFFDLWKR